MHSNDSNLSVDRFGRAPMMSSRESEQNGGRCAVESPHRRRPTPGLAQNCLASVFLAAGVAFSVLTAALFAPDEAMGADMKAPALPKMPELPKAPELPKTSAADESPIEYFVAVDDKQSGPFKCTKLLEMASQHTLTPESKVWKSGMPDWRRAGAMKDLEAIFASVPPPINDDSSAVEPKQTTPVLPCAAKPAAKKWWWPF